MGNYMSSNEKENKFNRSFNDLNKKKTQSIELEGEEKIFLSRHRHSETKLALNDKTRQQYFQKLQQKNKKEIGNRLSDNSQGSLSNSILTRNNLETFDELDSCKEISYSYVDKKDCLDNSNHNKSICDNFDNISLEDKSRIGITNLNTTNDKNNKKRDSLVSKNTNNTNNLLRRKSLSSEHNDKNSFSISKNTLILNNNELETDLKTLDNNFDNSDNNIDLSKKKRKENLSSDKINKSNSQWAIYDKTSEISNTYVFDNISVISNIYKSRISANTIINQHNNDYELNFVKKGEDIRRSYIAKLIDKKIWPSKKEKDHNSLIIFDWDDTLLCTSFLTPNGVYNEDMELNDKDKEKFAKLEFSVLRILTAAINKGDTYIITNAAPGWVEFSAEKYYPSVKNILNKVHIISARGEYESSYPGDSRMWKIQSFLNMGKYFDSRLVTNIICFGDSFIEMEAGHVLASKFSQAFIKTIKFRESPKPEELNKQLSLVADQFLSIFSAIKNLTIRVEKKTKR
jgi:hypothetical protein